MYARQEESGNCKGVSNPLSLLKGFDAPLHLSAGPDVCHTGSERGAGGWRSTRLMC